MEALHECLVAGLSADDAQRRAAEASLAQLSAQPGYVRALSELACAGAAAYAVEVRQLALLVLKGYVNAGSWAGVPEQDRAAVRSLLVQAVVDPTPRIRTAASAVVGRVAKEDWPAEWPELMQVLIGHIGSGATDRMAGAIRCIQIFADDISDSQLPVALSALWPMLQQVAVTAAVGAQIRARAVSVIHSLFTMVGACVGAVALDVKRHLMAFLDPCLETCANVLRTADQRTESAEHGVTFQALAVMMVLLRMFPKRMEAALPTLLPLVTRMLAAARASHQQIVDGTGGDDLDGYDSDGSPVGANMCTAQLIELVCTLVEIPRFRRALLPEMGSISLALAACAQITDEQLETWDSDLNQYVLEEGDDSYEYSIRLSSQHVLQEISRTYGEQGQSAIVAAAQQLMHEATVQRQQGSPKWWKLREAGLLALGITLEDCEGESEVTAAGAAPAAPLIQELLASELSAPEETHPMLYSRSLVTAAQSCNAVILIANEAGRDASTFLDTCVAVLEATGLGLTTSSSPAVKLAACRAVNRLVPCLKELGSGGMECLGSFASPLLAGLCSLLPQAQEDMLHSLFETVLVAVGANAAATLAAEPTLTPLLIRIWGNNLDDPLVTQYVLDTFSTMVRPSAESCSTSVCAKLVPHVCQILSGGVEVPEGALESTVDLLTVLVRSGCCDMGAQSTASAFMLVTRLSGADGAASCSVDHSVLQNAAQCVRVFVQTMPEQVCAMKISEGVTGLHRCVAVISWLLSPDVDDSAAMEVGSLITALIRRCAHVIGSVVTDILKSVVVRLRTAHMPSFIQELLLVLAHVTNSQGGQQTLDFLSTCGDDGVAYVLDCWLENLMYMMRPYDVKVVCAALGAVCSTRDPRVLAVQTTIESEAEATGGEGGDSGSIASRTRSLAPPQKVVVGLTAAVMRGLVRAIGREELHAQERASASTDMFGYGGGNGTSFEDGEDGDDDDGDEEYGEDEHGHFDGMGTGAEDGGGGGGGGIFSDAGDFAQFEQFLNLADGDDYDDEDEEENPDDKADELFGTELKAIVGTYARGVYSALGPEGFGSECAIFSAKERTYMQNILVETA